MVAGNRTERQKKDSNFGLHHRYTYAPGAENRCFLRRFHVRRRLEMPGTVRRARRSRLPKKDGATVAVTIYDVVFDIAPYVTLACQNCFSQFRHRRELSAMLNTRIR